MMRVVLAAEVDVGAEVAGDVEVEQPIAIEVEPYAPLEFIHVESPTARHVFEVPVPRCGRAADSPTCSEQVFEPVVVVVTPDRPIDHTFTGAIDCSETGSARESRNVPSFWSSRARSRTEFATMVK